MSKIALVSRSNRLYADSALPVGSEVLWQRHGFGVSPATIRNVMAELESQELVTHPHTSAGRVPTDRGYRYYVDLLMEPRRLRPEEETTIDSMMRSDRDDPVQFLQQAARHLAELTHEASVVLVPQLAEGSFRHLKLICMDAHEVVGVLIATEGMIKHVLLEIEEPVDQDEMARIERFLNQELSGMPLTHVHQYLERAMLENSAFFHLYKRSMDLLKLSPFFEETPALILEGTRWLFDAPEFQKMERARRLIRGLEEHDELEEILRKDMDAGGVKVHIGFENRGTSLTDCTVVAAPYRMRGGATGVIAVVGPTRMNYPWVTGVVGRAAQALCRAFQEREREEHGRPHRR